MSVIEAKLNDSLSHVAQYARGGRYYDAIEALRTLISSMDGWFRAEPQIHRMYFRSYYRALKASVYTDLGLYQWLSEDISAACASFEYSLQFLPTHLALQRLGYLALLNDASDTVIRYLLLMVSDPILEYEQFTRLQAPYNTHPSEILALRAATVAYYGNIVEGINLVTLALAYHSQVSEDIAAPVVCRQLREGVPPKVIKNIPDAKTMKPAELRKYQLILRVFVSLCKAAVDKCVKLPIVVSCDIRSILTHVFGEFSKLIVSNVIFDPTGLYQMLLDEYVTVKGDIAALRVDITNKGYITDLYLFTFPLMKDTRLTTRSFTGILRNRSFTDATWKLLSSYNRQAARRAAELGMGALSQMRIVDELALIDYVSRVYDMRLAPVLSDRPKTRGHVKVADIPTIALGDIVTTALTDQPTASELALHALTHHTRSPSLDSFDSCVMETKESLMRAFQEAVQSRKNPNSARHIFVQKSTPVHPSTPIRSLEISGLHLCASPTDIAESVTDTALGQPMTPLDTLWTKHISTCQECKDPKPTYQTRKITQKDDLEACIEGYQQNQQQLTDGAPYTIGLSGIYNGEVERAKNTSALSRFMLTSTIQAVQESYGSPIKPFSKNYRRILRKLQTNDQDYLLETTAERNLSTPNGTINANVLLGELSTSPSHKARKSMGKAKQTRAKKTTKPTHSYANTSSTEAAITLLQKPKNPQQKHTCKAQANSQAHPAIDGVAPKILTTVTPVGNTVAEKVILDYAAVKEPQQVESVYKNIGLVTTILQKHGSAPARDQSDGSTNQASTLHDFKESTQALLTGGGVPKYTNIIAYCAPYDDRGAEDNDGTLCPPLLPEPQKVDLFQYCHPEPAASHITSSHTSEAIAKDTLASTSICVAPEPNVTTTEYKPRVYNRSIRDYIVEEMPPSPKPIVPRLITDNCPPLKSLIGQKSQRRTMEINHVCSANKNTMYRYTGKSISALLTNMQK